MNMSGESGRIPAVRISANKFTRVFNPDFWRSEFPFQIRSAQSSATVRAEPVKHFFMRLLNTPLHSGEVDFITQRKHAEFGVERWMGSVANKTNVHEI